jgi:uncharacterized protein (DUF849 family)
MLQACLNGGLSKSIHPRVPITPSELARDAVAVQAAGAEELHIHVRDQDGAETLEPMAVAETLIAIRKAVPKMPVGIGTGAWISPGGRSRHNHIRAWATRPDYASVNLNEADALEVIDLLASDGIGIEAGLWNRRDAERFVSDVAFEKCLRVLVEMTSGDPEEALREAHDVLKILDRARCPLPVLLHGEGRSVWPCVTTAWKLGLSSRVGFEDGLHLPSGAVADDNAALVRAALTLRRL